MFELGVPNWYETQTVIANDFLNDKLESDQYGIYYSVKFTGDADTHLMQAKTKPEEGKKYYGAIEKSKSGKSTRFKKHKLPEGEVPAGAASGQSDKGDAIQGAMCVKLAYQAFISAEGMLPQEARHWRQIEYQSEMLFKTINNVKAGTEPVKPPTEALLDEVVEVPEEGIPDFGEDDAVKEV